MIDAATERITDGLSMIFLDWAKAFDRVKGSSLLHALSRFGFPQHIIDVISSIYEERKLFIHDHFGDSSILCQHAGIAQGCPLSPFLFVILQSVMFHDIYAKINLDPEPDYVVTNEVLYADDTVLVSSSEKNLQILINAVVTEGAKYGLELHWGKTYQMDINANASIRRPNGEVSEKKRSVVYLGGLISCDGKVASEIRRRVSECRNIVNSLLRLWSHANISNHRKIEIFTACVTSKVLYSLESLWLLKAECDQLDAFQAWALRRVLRIPPSLISRISNADVLNTVHQLKFSSILKERQAQLYNKIRSLPIGSMLRSLVCDLNGYPKTWHSRRSRGRPRLRWASEVFKLTTA